MLVGHVADCPVIGLELARPLGAQGRRGAERTMCDETCEEHAGAIVRAAREVENERDDEYDDPDQGGER